MLQVNAKDPYLTDPYLTDPYLTEPTMYSIHGPMGHPL